MAMEIGFCWFAKSQFMGIPGYQLMVNTNRYTIGHLM